MPANDTASQSQPSQPLNIWAQMSYTAPRGSCSQKNGMLITCSCYRFMVHPLKAATTFDCDGCGHHASFHKMDNPLDEEVVRRWKENDALRLEVFRQGLEARLEAQEVAPKRRRRTADGSSATAALEVEEFVSDLGRLNEIPDRKRSRRD